MIDQSLIGYELSSHTVEVEKWRLRFFAKVTGQTDPLYIDEEVAFKAGYRSLPVPATFLFCLNFDAPDQFEIFKVLKVDIGKILHGEQQFTYHKDVCAGDVLTFKPCIADIQKKKGGKMHVVYNDIRVEDQTGDHVADLRSIIIVRH